MTIYHWDLRKKKKTGGSKKAFRGKRKHESGDVQADTRISTAGDLVQRKRVKGGGFKLSLGESKSVNVNFSDGRTTRAEILALADNPSNPLYTRKGIITKGAILKTSLGLVRVSSKTGSDGVLNGRIMEEKK